MGWEFDRVGYGMSLLTTVVTLLGNHLSMDEALVAATGDHPFRLPPDHEQKWKECVYAARSCELVLAQLPDPSPGSDLAAADQLPVGESLDLGARLPPRIG
jgi:hypothetical protein